MAQARQVVNNKTHGNQTKKGDVLMQTDFFDQRENAADEPETPRLRPTTVTRPRVFIYDGQTFEDPGPEYSVQDVLAHLAQTYPELASGTWHSRTLPDSTEEITFVKVTGEKGSQANFFDQPADGSPLLSGPIVQPAKRLFLYDGQVFDDPGPEYGVQDVLNFLAQTYPELANGTWHSRTLPDGTEEITFVKVTGEKGGHALVEPGQRRQR
jgi:PRTRC genetic system protein C